MNWKTLGLMLILLIMMVSGAFAYSGFNRYYYTDYYTPSYYYPTPYHVNTYNYAQPSYYTASYYPSTYYSAYSYYPSYSSYYTTYYPATYGYAYAPTVRNYSSVSIYGGNNSWGVSVSRGSVCSIYGYC